MVPSSTHDLFFAHYLCQLTQQIDPSKVASLTGLSVNGDACGQTQREGRKGEF